MGGTGTVLANAISMPKAILRPNHPNHPNGKNSGKVVNVYETE